VFSVLTGIAKWLLVISLASFLISFYATFFRAPYSISDPLVGPHRRQARRTFILFGITACCAELFVRLSGGRKNDLILDAHLVVVTVVFLSLWGLTTRYSGVKDPSTHGCLATLLLFGVIIMAVTSIMLIIPRW